MNKLYLTCTNNKNFEEWAKQNRKRLKKTPAALDHFNQGYNQFISKISTGYNPSIFNTYDAPIFRTRKLSTGSRSY